MIRLILASLRRRRGRAAALLLGVLVATTGFTVLTSSTATSRLQVTGTVAEHSRGAYDVLVRPAGSGTDLERRRGLVAPNFLAGQYGGITPDQWRAVTRLPGVEVAAPVAMLGYVGSGGTVEVDVTDALDLTAERQLIEVRPRYRADRGLTDALAGPAQLVYVTRRPLTWAGDEIAARLLESDRGAPAPYSDGVIRRGRVCDDEFVVWPPYEIQEDGEALPICWPDSFHVAQLTDDGRFLRHEAWPGDPVAQDRLTVPVSAAIPLLVAAIDPGQEAALVGLDRAVVDGRYLADDEPAVAVPFEAETEVDDVLAAPALFAARPLVDEQVSVEARPVDLSGATTVAGPGTEAAAALVDRLPVGDPWASAAASVTEAYRAEPWTSPYLLDNGWVRLGVRMRVGPALANEGPDGLLMPATHPPVAPGWPTGSIQWRSNPYVSGVARMPPLADDVSFRAVEIDQSERSLGELDVTSTVGIFDPDLVAGFDELSQVPLETYRPQRTAGADAASRTLLADQQLWPSSNPGGYLTSPPAVLLSLGTVLAHGSDPAPISAVRVRVAGVTGFDTLSRERVRVVAEQIATATGLEVDIVFGSSPAPREVALPAGEFGRPELRLAEDWSLKGAAVAIVEAVDRKSVALFGLILVVCVLFLANASMAAVRDRRRELAVLACLGWPRWRLGATVAGEVVVVGLVAGALGGLAAPLLGGLAGIEVPLGRGLLAVPVALGLALAASVVPAWRASRAHPGSAVHPAVTPPRTRARHRRTVLGMAVGNLLRTPGRTAVGVVALAVGIAGLMLVAAVTWAFHGTVTGSLLGDAVSARVRGVDMMAVVATLLLGLVAVADVLYLNVRERAGELAALRATGWSELALGRLVAFEGLGIGALAAVLGAGAGLAGAAWFAGSLPLSLVGTGAATAVAGVALAGLAALVPALLPRRASVSSLLAEE